jgi:hypothetical protein
MSIFTWTIDAHPEDIDKIDFKRPNGEPVMRTPGDYRQLNDALFHAGTNSGSQYEWEDTANRLHFYIIDVKRDARGIRSYTLAVRSLDGAGPQTRGVSLAVPQASAVDKRVLLNFALTNTGSSAATPTGAHPRDESAFLDDDIYRITESITGDGWTADLPDALAAVKFGGSRQIPVVVRRTDNAAPSADLTVTARSESDPTRVSTVHITLAR